MKRVKNKEQFMNNNTALMQTMKENFPKIYKCAIEVGKFMVDKYNSQISEDEILYLMIHINRMVQSTVT